MNKISSLFLLDIGQRAYSLIYKELLKISKEGQSTKCSQTHTRTLKTHQYFKIFNPLLMKCKLNFWDTIYHVIMRLHCSFSWGMKTLDSKETTILTFLSSQDQPTFILFFIFIWLKKGGLKHWRLRGDLKRGFLKTLSLLGSTTKESSKETWVSNLRSGEEHFRGILSVAHSALLLSCTSHYRTKG